MKLIDLTHTFTSAMPVFPGDPLPKLEQVAHIKKDTFNDHKITTVMHVGTHIDAPLHMLENGKTVDEISLEKFFGKGIILDVRGKEYIDLSALTNVTIETGSVVLLYTGFGEKYGTNDYFTKSPALTENFANKLVEMGINMVGMDMSGPDHDNPWTTHKMLLSNDIMILENLTNLDQLLGVKNFEVIALPAKLQADAAPVRVVAKVS